MEKLTTLYLRKIDLQLKNDFKAICIRKNKTMTAEIQRLMRKEVEKEDPFSNPNRINDNASPDTDAAEQFGHARTSAIKEQIDRKIVQSRKALSRVKVGKYGICGDCGKFIDTDRLMVYPEATLCPKCQAKRES